MHGAALAPHQTIVALHQFAEHLLHRHAARQRMRVPAIGAERLVALAHRDAEPGRDRLLTDRQMTRALDHVLQEQILPLYYEQKDVWRQVVKNGMADVRFQFDSGRMVTEYYEKLYV